MTKEEETPISYPVSGGQQAEFKPLVSVIVPVYNVEPYLHRCIDSLVHQTLKDIEIILIDDGSTDGCGKICDEYAAADTRIRVVHQENAGLSEARNAGIDRAQADYLMFVDSDDWVQAEFCEIPLMLAKEHQADLVMFQARFIKSRRHWVNHTTISDGTKTQTDAIRLLIDGVGMAAWNKLYHRKLFLENRYPKGRVYEEVSLTPILVHEAKIIMYSSAILYNREYRNGSITTILSEKNAEDYFDALRFATQNLRKWGYVQESESYLNRRLLEFVSKGWHSPEHNEWCVRYFRNLNHCPKHFSWKWKGMYHLLLISPGLCRMVYKAYMTIYLLSR